MGKFYGFGHIFKIGLNILSFPSLVFFLHNIRTGWRIWYRYWRNTLARFGGWIIMKRWAEEFKNGGFLEKLDKAQEHIDKSSKLLS